MPGITIRLFRKDAVGNAFIKCTDCQITLPFQIGTDNGGYAVIQQKFFRLLRKIEANNLISASKPCAVKRRCDKFSIISTKNTFDLIYQYSPTRLQIFNRL